MSSCKQEWWRPVRVGAGGGECCVAEAAGRKLVCKLQLRRMHASQQQPRRAHVGRKGRGGNRPAEAAARACPVAAVQRSGPGAAPTVDAVERWAARGMSGHGGRQAWPIRGLILQQNRLDTWKKSRNVDEFSKSCVISYDLQETLLKLIQIFWKLCWNSSNLLWLWNSRLKLEVSVFEPATQPSISKFQFLKLKFQILKLEAHTKLSWNSKFYSWNLLKFLWKLMKLFWNFCWNSLEILWNMRNPLKTWNFC